jgi:alcohol dehydrogenase class IV
MAVEKFATMGRIFDLTLNDQPNGVAAEQSCEFIDELLKQIGMWLGLKNLGASEADVVAIADHSQVLPDYKNNPRIANRDEIYDVLMAGYKHI